MAILDDTIGAVLLMVIFLAAGVMLVNSYTQQLSQKQEFRNQDSIEQEIAASFDAALLVTEPGTRRSFGELIASAAYYRDETVQSADGQINITENFGSLLSGILPESGYHLEVSPKYKRIELIFIVDGSDSMRDEMAYLASNMASIIINVRNRTGLDTLARIYVLDLENSTWCQGTGVPCTYLISDDFYFNGSFSAFDLRKHKYNLNPAPHFGEEEEVWKSDWETAMAMLTITEDNSDLSLLKVLLPFTDSLPGSTKYLYPCPEFYSAQIFSRDQRLLRQFNFIFDPVLSANSDPIMYCDKETERHMKGLITGNNGELIIHRDNLALRIGDVVARNIEGARLTIGQQQSGKSYSLTRHLPMPNGELAEATLQVYAR
jgi:hypothetical protein